MIFILVLYRLVQEGNFEQAFGVGMVMTDSSQDPSSSLLPRPISRHRVVCLGLDGARTRYIVGRGRRLGWRGP